ncbi:MAG: type II toxin-antitoxin system RelE/ParE family toxin [Brevundimonas sp.]|uniref:type II toxin-antitoxin system RelE/ParE family toxin n=1 Tax=Brevundimonas sp. TaxID=1871086 RepID=UPI002627CBF7|nr:type II toxin-antitoxin system RelE/ParE family toxin [Brevundimonas sp.]MDI6624265.1 type II toxin-antitoxin system RelE/ParE family toxin [Brevundimonas sp.]MDQ7813038.1 type II toxin-antitoxin system RelE/ParE family toxin [Brevundimonas sp.]
MASLRLSETARADIRAIYRQGVEGFGVRRADAYAAALRLAIKRLAEFPESASLREGLDGPVRVLPFRSHIVIYAIDEGGVHILRVRHGHEDWIGNPTGDHR